MTRVISNPQGRPVSTGRGYAPRVSVRLTPHELERIDRAARAQGVTRAEFLRLAGLAAAEERA